MEEDIKPPGKLRVGLTYNLKKDTFSGNDDTEAEYDNIETIYAIREALEHYGCSVQLMEANADLPKKLSERTADIVFNIAEGTRGRGREAQVPAMLNFYGIPYTGSDETTLCIALDKALAKRLLSTYRIRTTRYRVVSNENRGAGGLKFPLIVKPNAEGSSKGISGISVVYDAQELKALLDRNFDMYGQDMLVEEYIAGREFTVGILGNGRDKRVFPPMEIVYLKKERFNIYSFEVKKDYEKLIRYECPAHIDSKTESEIIRMSCVIFDALRCRDFARIDFRLSEEGKAYFIEINPLPGLAPGYSDFPMLAQFCGVGYPELVSGVLQSALKRYGSKYILKEAT